MSRLWVVCVILSAAFASQSTARAQEAGAQSLAEANAREAFDRGNVCFDARDYACAADAYRESIAMLERPSVVFNLAKALKYLNQWVQARDMARRFLSIADVRGDARRFDEAQRLLQECEHAIARIRVVVNNDLATLTIDNEEVPVPMTAPREVNPGTHTLVVSAPGMIVAEREVTVALGETSTIEMALVQRDAVESPSSDLLQTATASEMPDAHASATVPLTAPETPLAKKPWFWVTIASAAVVVATSVTLGIVLSSSRENGIDSSTGWTVDALRSGAR